MYSISDYGKMISDSNRMAAYRLALRKSIKPDMTVIDIGTGTGIMALLACQFGARRVYAIEPGGVIQAAREIAAANGYADRIEFIQDLSVRVSLPERADVIVSDLRGVLPLSGLHIPAIVDARQRWLAPNGTLIPQRDDLWVVLVEAPVLYHNLTCPWQEASFGLDFCPARNYVIHTWRKARVSPDQFLVAPKLWTSLDYTEVESPNVSGTLTWTARRAGTAHGFMAWFDATLTEGACFSNAPGEVELIYGSAFFPWLQPVELKAGDIVSVFLKADLAGENYIWRWETRVTDQGRSDQVKAQFKQSTFFSLPMSQADFRKCETGHLPELNKEGRIDRFVLVLMDGQTSLEQIARKALEKFPHHFPSFPDALNRVAGLSRKFSR